MAKAIKAPSYPVPQSRDEAARLLGDIGRLQRDLGAVAAQCESAIDAAKLEAARAAKPLQEAIELRFKALAAWAEANKTALLEDGGRSITLPTGELGWRWTPPAVKVARDALDSVIAQLKALRLRRFLRVSVELDKTAVLKEPSAVARVEGLSVEQVEIFWAKPTDVDAALEAKTKAKRTGADVRSETTEKAA